MNFKDKLSEVDQLKEKINSFGEFPAEVLKKINYKFRLDWNYYSNRMEGNTLTKAETRSVMVGYITIGGKPMKDVLEMERHDKLITELLGVGMGMQRLSETRIKDIHTAIMHEDDPEKRKDIGIWKKEANHVINYKGEKNEFTVPDDVPNAIHGLLNETNAAMDKMIANKATMHPVEVALQFHLKYVGIHPFYDGNGRTARILMNLLLISFGYPPLLISTGDKDKYYQLLADIQGYGGEPDLFYTFMADLLIRSQQLVLSALEGKDISETDDLDKKIELLSTSIKGKQKRVAKSSEVVQGVLFKTYLPLLSNVESKIKKFEKLFKEFDWSFIGVKVDGKSQIQSAPNLSPIHVFFTDIPVTTFFIYDFRTSINLRRFNDEDDSFDVNLIFNIEFEKYNYSLDVTIGNANLSNKLVGMMRDTLDLIREESDIGKLGWKHNLTCNYGNNLSEQELEVWINELAEKVYNYIVARKEKWEQEKEENN